MPKSKVFTSSPGADITFNVVPLIDVIFVLIMFLVLTCQITSASYADLMLPTPLEPSVVNLEANQTDAPNRVVVNVLWKEGADSGAALSYRIAGNDLSLARYDMRDANLVTEVANRVKEHKDKAIGYKEFHIDLRADHRVEHRYVQPILLAAAKLSGAGTAAGAKDPNRMEIKVNIAAKRKEE